jgi:hypothetical protein
MKLELTKLPSNTVLLIAAAIALVAIFVYERVSREPFVLTTRPTIAPFDRITRYYGRRAKFPGYNNTNTVIATSANIHRLHYFHQNQWKSRSCGWLINSLFFPAGYNARAIVYISYSETEPLMIVTFSSVEEAVWVANAWVGEGKTSESGLTFIEMAAMLYLDYSSGVLKSQWPHPMLKHASRLLESLPYVKMVLQFQNKPLRPGQELPLPRGVDYKRTENTVRSISELPKEWPLIKIEKQSWWEGTE